ncbi:HNH endonuclease [Paraburkholderia sp. 2C]
MPETLAPTADQQLAFLRQLQLVFDEGEFSSTYKYALLLALGELAVEMGDDTGSSLQIPIERIAEKFIEFYWPQSVPYVDIDLGESVVLSQNLGQQQASVITSLQRLRSRGIATLTQAKESPYWFDTIRDISATVKEMPIRHLQNVSGTTISFLYALPVVGNAVELLPGVSYSLRQFQGFLQQLARTGWTAHVSANRRNTRLIGRSARLERFLFGTSRADLSDVASILRPLQDDRCFFCQGKLYDQAVVDHFIPWSRYPRDTALNFVVAHATCNADKRELLAGQPHLDRWLERNYQRHEDIGFAIAEVGFVSNLTVTNTIAKWAYRQAYEARGHFWLRQRQTEPATAQIMMAFA